MIIVRYLDQAYPDTPRLIAPGTEVLLATLHALVLANVSAPLYGPIASRIVSTMDEDSATVYRGRVERVIGTSIEEFLSTSGEEDSQEWIWSCGQLYPKGRAGSMGRKGKRALAVPCRRRALVC
ncbi:hypothetical protein DFP72DRAFT_937617 [Ephemerocybe angulata]|uniref:Uncharacterized protein n=1 Tax=Ephemerocybe angulata TaxID=980116 RepID=A0A8H6H944_9AGAR|nr:hypothetical protein DFP72DRAFT_937617 [Tulosesus angulatus]